MKIVDELPKTYTGQHFAKQLVRSGTSPAFQYGEAQAAESRKDFIHKLKIGQKELRETLVCLTIIKKHPLSTSKQIEIALKECDELIAIFHSSIATAKKNLATNGY
jgi:four helix bundle protein